MSRLITINSVNRVSGNPGRFVTRVQRQSLNKGNYTIKVISASIPLSFYNVNTTNNGLVIDGTAYTMTPSKYTSVTLATEIERILVLHNAADVSTVSINTSSGKLNITPSHNYIFNTTSALFTSTSVLGLNTAIDVTITAAVDYAGPNLVYLSGVDVFYLRLPGLVNNSYADFPGHPNDFVAVIDVTENHLNYAIQKFLPNQSAPLQLTAKVLDDITVILVDQNGQEVDLNGAQTGFSFVIEEVIM